MKRYPYNMPDPDVHINIRETINSGQIFLWENYGNEWFVIDGQDVIIAKQTPFNVFTFSKNTKKFFREDDNYGKILKNITRDKTKGRPKSVPTKPSRASRPARRFDKPRA